MTGTALLASAVRLGVLLSVGHHLRSKPQRRILRRVSMRRRGLVIVLAASAAVAGCGSGGGVPASASCASLIKYDGQDYIGRSAKVRPSDLGPELGRARIPACNDTGGSAERDEEVVAVEIKGVSPSVAVAATHTDSVVFTRKDQHLGSLPEGVRRLLRETSAPSPVASPVSKSDANGRAFINRCVGAESPAPAPEYVGLTEDQATRAKQPESAGTVSEVRVVGRDGTCLGRSRDFQGDRVNVLIAAGKVVWAGRF